MKRDINLAVQALGTDRNGLARHLGLAAGALRAWETRGAPLYARLALAAVVVGLDPEKAMNAAEARNAKQGTDSSVMM